MKILVITDDIFLYKKAYLELSEIHTVTSDISESDISVIIYDCDSIFSLPSFDGIIIKLSRNNKDDSYPLPLPIGKLEELIEKKDKSPRLSLSNDGKYAILDGNNIKLTTLEFSLLSLLIHGGENYTSREKISKEVWENAGDGLINIYIHYLRAKLEKGGEKIILASRNLGYKINEKYLGGSAC